MKSLTTEEKFAYANQLAITLANKVGGGKSSSTEKESLIVGFVAHIMGKIAEKEISFEDLEQWARDIVFKLGITLEEPIFLNDLNCGEA
ncbi:MAG: hypothetical protein V1845_01400 [bacterium]